jgi:hypothetical protein
VDALNIRADFDRRVIQGFRCQILYYGKKKSSSPIQKWLLIIRKFSTIRKVIELSVSLLTEAC